MEGDSFTSNFDGMSNTQLYEIMSQMKNLIEQNQPQARLILAENPALTKALFQAQILLGMVKFPKVIPSIQQAPSQPPSEQPVQTPSVQAQSVPVPVPAGSQVQETGVQIQIPARKESNHPSSTIPYTSVLTGTYQSVPSHPQHSLQQAKVHMGTQGMPMSHPPSSQVANIAPHQHQSTQQPPLFRQFQAPIISNHPQHTQHSSDAHHPMQPRLPPQPQPPTTQPLQHQLHPQMRPHSGFRTSPASQPHVQQQQFSGAIRHPGNIKFGQGPPPIPNQLPTPPGYQGGRSHFRPDYNNQGGHPMQVDTAPPMPGPSNNPTTGAQLPGPPPLPTQMGPGIQPPRPQPGKGSHFRPDYNQGGRPMQVDTAPWVRGPSDNPTGGAQLPGPPPLPTQMRPGIQPPRPQPIPSELGRSLLQQVMSLTPEQINCLPPEQRQQVYQLQQMLR